MHRSGHKTLFLHAIRSFTVDYDASARKGRTFNRLDALSRRIPSRLARISEKTQIFSWILLRNRDKTEIPNGRRVHAETERPESLPLAPSPSTARGVTHERRSRWRKTAAEIRFDPHAFRPRRRAGCFLAVDEQAEAQNNNNSPE